MRTECYSIPLSGRAVALEVMTTDEQNGERMSCIPNVCRGGDDERVGTDNRHLGEERDRWKANMVIEEEQRAVTLRKNHEQVEEEADSCP